MQAIRRDAEWLETDGLGGFASGTVAGERTRRYHALLLSATRPPTGRYVLVNGVDATVTTPTGAFPISSQRYRPGVLHPDGGSSLIAFRDDPWPTWTFRIGDGTVVEHEVFMRRGSPVVVLSWKRTAGRGAATLLVRPFLAGRDYHALHHENPDFQFAPEEEPGRLVWRPYTGVPAIEARHGGTYIHEPLWYRGFLYSEEQARGLDHVEDLASPGVFRFDLDRGEAALIFSARGAPDGAAVALPSDGARSPVHGLASSGWLGAGDAMAELRSLRAAEKRRRQEFPSRLHRGAEDYLVRRGQGMTIVAGYPWFADWGRDTFIALRGLCLATGRLDEARDILLQWAEAISCGMLPNRFPDQGEEPEFNSVDASLWYVVAVHDYLRTGASSRRAVPDSARTTLARAVGAIVTGYARGTRYGIRMDGDGLLTAGVPGAQLTWMDARVDDRVVTPRIGKPVEVEALWINALRIAAELGVYGAEGREPADWKAARAAFRRRFWNDGRGCLYDVVDVDHLASTTDGTIRPNQILAVGGLPYPLLEGDEARRVVEVVEASLLTPIGLRSLAPGEPGYAPRYEGGVAERDGAYHQGTVWPWLLGPFVEAWVRVRGGTAAALSEARERFLLPLAAHLAEAGLGHVSEIADAETPFTPRGCPFQAWSVGEMLRLSDDVLAPRRRTAESSRRARASVRT